MEAKMTNCPKCMGDSIFMRRGGVGWKETDSQTIPQPLIRTHIRQGGTAVPHPLI